MKGWVTINTDAGFFPRQKVGSYAYWIKGDAIHLYGSGMLKGNIKSPLEAEMMAIANALHVLSKSPHPPIIKIIFNRDNIYAESKKKGNHVQKIIYRYIQHFKKDALKRDKKRVLPNWTKYYEFRHVKAHSDTDDKRSWVNRWCDEQCKLQLREWLQKNPF